MENNTTAKKASHFDVFFQRTPCLPSHVHALRTDADGYIKDLEKTLDNGAFAAVSSGVRARMLAALHITSQHATIPMLLEQCEASDVAKALTLLDRARSSRQLHRKIKQIENEHPELVKIEGEEECDRDARKAGEKKRKKRRKIDLYRSQKRAIEAELNAEVQHKEQACSEAHADTAVMELIQSSSVSGALARKVRHWAKTCLKSDFLEFVMLTLTPEPWKIIADLVHFNPGDFSVPYFLHDVHRDPNAEKERCSEEVAEATFVQCMRDLVQDLDNDHLCKRFYDVAEEFPQVYLCYSFIRTHKKMMSQAGIIEQFASNMPLDTALWYFEELFEASPNCESIIRERLKGAKELFHSTRKSKTTYGKLIERILTFRRMTTPNYKEMESLTTMFGAPWTPQMLSAVLRHYDGDLEETVEAILDHNENDPTSLVRRLKGKGRRALSHSDGQSNDTSVSNGLAEDVIPLAEARLEELKTKWRGRADAKVAVFGDASASMQSAIEAATIFASMVSVCFDGELSFFNQGLVPSPHVKPSTVCETLDVCEKIRADGTTSLAAALWPYYEAKKSIDMIVLVTDEEENSRCRGHNFADLLAKYKTEVNTEVTLIIVCVGKGNSEFRQNLMDAGITYQVVYIDGSRPDLAKFDALLGQLAIISSVCAGDYDNDSQKKGAGGEEDSDWTIL